MDCLGKRLKEARENLDLKQIEVSKKLGINNDMLSKYERNFSSPDPDNLKLLCDFYNISTDYVLGLTDSYTLLDKHSIKLTEDEHRLLDFYRLLGYKEQSMVVGDIARLLLEKEKKIRNPKI